MTLTKTPAAVCGSRGPHIDGQGSPRCAGPLEHPGLHKGFQGSGFEREWWGDPAWRDVEFASEWAAIHGGPEAGFSVR